MSSRYWPAEVSRRYSPEDEMRRSILLAGEPAATLSAALLLIMLAAGIGAVAGAPAAGVVEAAL